MQLRHYLRILWRRGWIMVLLAIITAAAAFAFSLIVKERAPLYRSTIKILVQPARTDFGQAQAAKQLLGPYEAWLNSTYRAAEVIDELKLDMMPLELLNDVRIAGDINSLVITIEVENPDGDLANDIARNWASLFIQWRNDRNQTVRREDRIDAEILDDPRYGLERPKTAINTAAGGILGFMIGLAVVFVLEYIESGIFRSAEDINRFLGVPVLGVVPPTQGES
jgi:capsular polysaccharide biosynthesis protein